MPKLRKTDDGLSRKTSKKCQTSKTDSNGFSMKTSKKLKITAHRAVVFLVNGSVPSRGFLSDRIRVAFFLATDAESHFS